MNNNLVLPLLPGILDTNWFRDSSNIQGIFGDVEYEVISNILGTNLISVTSEDSTDFANFRAILETISKVGEEVPLLENTCEGHMYQSTIDGKGCIVIIKGPVDVLILADTSVISSSDLVRPLSTIKMMSYEDKFNLVKEFQEVGNVITTDEIKSLYVKLFFEEHQEFIVALHELTMSDTLNKEHLVEALDGLADMVVIQLGAHYHKVPSQDYFAALIVDSLEYLNHILVSKFHEFFNPNDYLQLVDTVFVDVMRSNMSKFCSSEVEADETNAMYLAMSIQTYWTRHNDHFVIRSSLNQTVEGKVYPEDKILKSINYSAPEILSILDKALELHNEG